MPEKIYFAEDGSVKIFDSYLETLVQVLIPYIFEKELEVSKNSGSVKIVDLPNFAELLLASLWCNDLFNFGSLILALATDFTFNPIMTVASGIDLNLEQISNLLLKKMESQISKENLVDFIWYCIHPDENRKHKFEMFRTHSFELEWKARILKERGSQVCLHL